LAGSEIEPSRPPPLKGDFLKVSEEELATAIRDSFTQANDAAYRAMVKLATEAALETYDQVVSDTVRQSRSRQAN
jgi:tRNA/tmRNA/rRNA uracil-C5-methylase (TrmA/RlmC/RlmD family)